MKCAYKTHLFDWANLKEIEGPQQKVMQDLHTLWVLPVFSATG